MNRTIKDWLFIFSILMGIALAVVVIVYGFDLSGGKQTDILLPWGD